MKNNFISAIIILALATFACSLPGAPATTEENDLAGTITAQALTIQAPTATLAPPTETATQEFTSTPEFTPTPSVPMVTVSVDTNCRTGPSTVYDRIGALLIGQTAEVVGKYTPQNYWIIKTPGSSGVCWLWGSYATVSGNTSNLPEYPVPPTPTPSIPLSPKNFHVAISCTWTASPFIHNEVASTLSWSDESNNESGFYVYRNGTLIATLAANTTNYVDNTTLPAIWLVGDPPPSITYAINSFNSAGNSSQKEKNVVCP